MTKRRSLHSGKIRTGKTTSSGKGAKVVRVSVHRRSSNGAVGLVQRKDSRKGELRNGKWHVKE